MFYIMSNGTTLLVGAWFRGKKLSIWMNFCSKFGDIHDEEKCHGMQRVCENCQMV